MVNFSNYEIVDNGMFFICAGQMGNTKVNPSESKYLYEYFSSKIENRLIALENWLIANGLPSKIKTLKDIENLHLFLATNVEPNGYSDDNNFFDADPSLIKDKYISTQTPSLDLAPLWKSVIIDIVITLGENHIAKYSDWSWDIQDFFPSQSISNGRICLFDRKSASSKEHQDFYDIMYELNDNYSRNLTKRQELRTDSLSSAYLNLEASANGRSEFYLPFGAKYFLRVEDSKYIELENKRW